MQPARENRRLSHDAWRPTAARGRPDRRHSSLDAIEVRPFTDKQIDLAHHLRRPGGHRDRERAPVRGGAGADGGAERGAAAADGDRRCAQGHQPLDLRPGDRARRRWSNRRRGCARPAPGQIWRADGERVTARGVHTVRSNSATSIRRTPSRDPPPAARARVGSRRDGAASCPDRRRRWPIAEYAFVEAASSSAVIAPVLGVPLLRERRARSA